jgi:serine/threonine-protein kinase HipA
MRRAKVFVHNLRAGTLLEKKQGEDYEFLYDEDYRGPPVSLSMPVHKKRFSYTQFPAFFDGLLPEGERLEALLRKRKIDAKDYLQQLIAIGTDLVGAVSVEEDVDG